MQNPRNHRRGARRSGSLRMALVLVGLASPGVGLAAADALQVAQNAGPNTALTVTEIRDCLCMEQQMNSYQEDLELRQDLLNERQQELSNIDQQVQEQRATLAPNDTVGQQVLRDLMTQQQTLRGLLQHDLRPSYNTEVNQLNALVTKYNGLCVNRQRYAIDVKTAQQDLQCPKP
jgi:DNA-binding transcriptional MerR regulator